ncbi:hypothetical protein FDI21_gp219 [Pseudomonas phage Noxifer]|uniref:Virion structural protein n=1 Tax=Pseudomonas phage Noxifer TaxID=2006684 RepID=A0A1Y0SVE0_9CAUD|nr:hypothetical protein FDI21_gp219 [Pseudomonas phage Noxifer]ARV77492.1 hypothetical protein NOXIFER_327 [Pseudomonas phage Noxifer]
MSENIQKFLDENIGNVGDERVSFEHYLVVSNEGFFQSIGDVWRNIRHGRTPKLTNDKGTPVLNKDTLNKTYLNPEWLAKRRFAEGEVSVSKYGKPFTGDYNAGMRALGDAWIAANKKNKAMAEPYFKRVEPTFEFVKAYHYNSPEKLKAFLDARDLSYTAPKFAVLDQKFDVSMEGAKLPALTREQCEKLVASIVYMADAFFSHYGYHERWSEHFDTTLNKRWYLYSNDGAKVLSQATYGSDVANRNLCFKLINEVYEFTSSFESDYYKRKCVGYDAFYAWLKGAVAWIDASVK